MMQISETEKDFLEYLKEWQNNLSTLNLKNVLANPEKSAVTSIDLVNGFCNSGALASSRVHEIIAPSVALFKSAWQLGVRHFVLLQDFHDADAIEFAQWPPHCVKGSNESEPIAEIRSLPFFSQMVTFPKNSINPAINTGFQGWLDAHPEIDTYIVIGDCTDLCTYQLAMHLRLEANACGRMRRVIVPANCVQTYDMPVTVAKSIGAMPHPGDLMHALFLYHMALNGVEVVHSLEAE
jgi:nicotinamidase-related amidase